MTHLYWMVFGCGRSALGLCLIILSFALRARADVGDPQIRTDHPWYPGELACSTFERLFATEAEQYEHVTGTKPVPMSKRPSQHGSGGTLITLMAKKGPKISG